eukprot:CAMPEP_0206046662 /NCGR_PEP_ID=MMETSP1466-20131121/19233_1 /ASSEMBLY_ACC=CAM_ASM_001126 /TAXON_ID=44452 /ORGANISM="Pavlova gyrans, Strain CCMP608" /LENGTH=47 /DNA_ID= /DNA_START= /DNA_END= /DNA_ORIENTATION=
MMSPPQAVHPRPGPPQLLPARAAEWSGEMTATAQSRIGPGFRPARPP